MPAPHSALTFLSIVARVESLASEHGLIGGFDEGFAWEDPYARGRPWPVTPLRSRRKKNLPKGERAYHIPVPWVDSSARRH